MIGLWSAWGHLDVVRAARALVDPAAADALVENGVRHRKCYNIRHFLSLGGEQLVEHLRLSANTIYVVIADDHSQSFVNVS